MNVLFIYLVVIISIITLLVFYFIKLPGPVTNIEKKGPYDLTSNTTLFNTNSFLTNSSVCFQGFFYLESLQKTGIVKLCSGTDPTKPSCNTGRYSLCPCNGTNCSTCYHEEYIPLIDFNSSTVKLEILAAPDASRQNKASTQITIKTQSSEDVSGILVTTTTPDLFMETFVLPPLPFQKWIMISINREGRRFDVYYNDILVLSKMTSAPIYNSSISDSITVGSSKLNGSSGMFSLYSSSQTAGTISQQYNSLISTRHSPLFDSQPPTIDWKNLSVHTLPLDTIPSINMSLPSISSSLCAGSDCIRNPTSVPSMPYYEWTTSYA